MSVKAILDNFEKINNFDFNLLFIFEAIYMYSSVSITAEKFDSSPSSVSQALNKLRNYFGDPLFVRKGQGLVATTVAEHLHEKIVNKLGRLVDSVVNVSDVSMRNKFTVYSTPYTAQLVIPGLCAAIYEQNLPYELTHISADASFNSADDILTYRKADLIFDTKPHYGNSTHTLLFKREIPIAVCSKNHPRMGDTLTLEDMRREKFTYINIDTQGLKRAQDMVSEFYNERMYFFSSSSVELNAAVAERTDCVSFITESFYKKFGECYNLKILKYDFPIEPICIYMSYNKSAMGNNNFVKLVEVIKKNIDPDQL